MGKREKGKTLTGVASYKNLSAILLPLPFSPFSYFPFFLPQNMRHPSPPSHKLD